MHALICREVTLSHMIKKKERKKDTEKEKMKRKETKSKRMKETKTRVYWGGNML